MFYFKVMFLFQDILHSTKGPPCEGDMIQWLELDFKLLKTMRSLILTCDLFSNPDIVTGLNDWMTAAVRWKYLCFEFALINILLYYITFWCVFYLAYISIVNITVYHTLERDFHIHLIVYSPPIYLTYWFSERLTFYIFAWNSLGADLWRQSLLAPPLDGSLKTSVLIKHSGGGALAPSLLAPPLRRC